MYENNTTVFVVVVVVYIPTNFCVYRKRSCGCFWTGRACDPTVQGVGLGDPFLTGAGRIFFPRFPVDSRIKIKVRKKRT